jgi:ABC-type oligopeptide transport system substrate-binding subunit
VQFLSGDLDTFLIDDSVAFADWVDFQTLQRNPGVRRQPYYHEQPLNTTYALEFNWKQAPFDDLNARKAFCLAINREPFNQQVYPGVSIPGWHIIPNGMAGYNPALTGLDGAPVTGDAALAKQYWHAYLAAHGGRAPQIGVAVSDATMLDALAHDWQRVLGVSVSVWVPDMIVTPPRAYQPLSIAAYGWAYADPQDAFPPDFASLPGECPFGVSVPAASALLRQADALGDMRQRLPLYQQAEQLFIDNGALCPLYQSVSAYALWPWVQGNFVEDGRGVFPNDAWVTGYIARH